MSEGGVIRVNGPVVEIEGIDTSMLELVEVGEARLPGEVIAVHGRVATVQVYEHTGGIRPGEPARGTGNPLLATLGPGLIGGVFDGMLRRLSGGPDTIAPGASSATLPADRRWRFTPATAAGAEARPGRVLGRFPETDAIEFRLLVPAGVRGTIEWIAEAGDVGIADPVARVGGVELTVVQTWPVRRPRPVAERRRGARPLTTGQRAIDLFYPVAEGSSAAVPGGFGTGKTVLLQQIAKWCDADVIVYVGCGERGNEMADVLSELSTLQDPRTGGALLNRTVLIANTSNMPVLAREASIYTGATVAEFYRDMGYRSIVIADSTSRWAEALREVASRTGELPAEEGYPAGLASALAAFYERAARVVTLGGADASVTILGAISPPGGDMSEPVSAHTRRFTRCTWTLDTDLAYARHYPAVSWTDSSSRDADPVGEWQARHGDPDWTARRNRALRLLADADRLESVAELVGAGSLPEPERLVLHTARLLREGVLQQSSLSVNDARCDPAKQVALLDLVLGIHDRCAQLLERGVALATIEQVDLTPVTRARDESPPDGAAHVRGLLRELLLQLGRVA
jgi:V/A-type H+-transporting ATPase subunit A